MRACVQRVDVNTPAASRRSAVTTYASALTITPCAAVPAIGFQCARGSRAREETIDEIQPTSAASTSASTASGIRTSSSSASITSVAAAY